VWVWRLSYAEPRTDDANVRANVVVIAPHVSGPIVELPVVDNQAVKAGDLLFVVDPRPYQARLERARAELRLAVREVEAQGRAVAAAGSEIARRQADHAAADAALVQTETGIAVADAEIARLEAEMAAAQSAQARLSADLAYAEDYLKRIEPLLALEFVTVDRVQEARSKQRALAAAVKEAERKQTAAAAAVAEARERRRAATSAVNAARARQRAAGAAVEQGRHDAARAADLLAQYGDGNARLEAARAAVASAELEVGYCRVTAPFDGYVTNLNIAVGEYARQGQQVVALVDNRSWYVIANFRETFLSSIRPGMAADVYLISHPGRRFRGVVQGIGWAIHQADGATVDGLPAVRQTLNWVRLANRIPVRILLEERDPAHPFRMGTTAVVTIRGDESSGAPAPAGPPAAAAPSAAPPPSAPRPSLPAPAVSR
jgi:multidrug efflux system membrane fusion protein